MKIHTCVEYKAVNRYNVVLTIALLSICLTTSVRADCQVAESGSSECDAELVALSDEDTTWLFQPPAINANGDVGFIALLDPASFSYGGFISPGGGAAAEAFPTGGSAQDSFSGIRVSTLDARRMFALDADGNLYGTVEVLDESGFPVLGMVRGGISGFGLLGDPATFPTGTFLNPNSGTEVLVNAAGTYAFAAEIRANNGATIVGEGLFRGDGTGTVAVLRTGNAAPDAGETYLGFFSSLNAGTPALSSGNELAFAAVVGGDGISAVNDERLIIQADGLFTTLVREGELVAADTPGLSFGASVGSTFAGVSYNSQQQTSFLARLQEGGAPSDFITGGVGGATDHDGLFIASQDLGLINVAIRGDEAGGVFDADRLTGTQFISGLGRGQLNDRGELAFFANAGLDASDRQSLGLFIYNPEVDTLATIFQTSGSTLEEVLAQGDAVDGLTFFASDAYLNELAINNTGDVVFTSDVIADLSSPPQHGLFLARSGGIDTLALEGGTIEVADGDVRTISLIEFIGGSTSSSRPTGFSDNGSIAFTLRFAGGGAGVFVDSLEFVPVVDFLWSGDCGSTNWHDGCANSNWDDRISGENAPRTPGTDPADRAFIVDSSVVIADAPVDLFSLNATGSLEVLQALSLAQSSNIEDLLLGADLSIGNNLRLGGANGVWRDGDVTGTGQLVLEGNSSESGRLVVDSTGVVRLAVGLDVGASGDFAIDGGTLVIDSAPGISINGLTASLSLVGGRIQKGSGNTSLYAIENTGQLIKGGMGTSVIEAGYRQTSGLVLIGGGELVMVGPSLFNTDIEVMDDATLTFQDNNVIWSNLSVVGAGNVVLSSARLSVEGDSSVDLVDGGALILQNAAELTGNDNLVLQENSVLRKTGDGEATVTGLSWRGLGEVEDGSLLVSDLSLANSQVDVGADGNLILGAGVNIVGEVAIEGEGIVQISDGQIIEPNSTRDTQLRIAADSLWQNVELAANLLTPLGGSEGSRESTLTVFNEGVATVAAGTVSTFTNVDFRNGRPFRVGVQDDGIVPGNFILQAGATLRLVDYNEFTNTLDSTMVIDGTLSAEGRALLQIFNGGSMRVGGEITADDTDSTFPIPFSNSGDLLLTDGGHIGVQLINQTNGTIRMVGGSARVGGAHRPFSNEGLISLSGGSSLIIDRLAEGTIAAGRFGYELLSGRWELTDSEFVLSEFPSARFTWIGADAELYVNNAGIELGSSFHGLDIAGLLSLENQTVDVRSVLGDEVFVAPEGELVLGPNSIVRASIFENYGLLRINEGVLDAIFPRNFGVVEIGASPGVGYVVGDFSNSGSIHIEIAGTQPGVDYDQLIVQGTTTFEPGGVIDITLLDPDETDGVDEIFRPSTGDVFEILVTDDLLLADGVDLASIFNFTNAPGGLRFDVDQILNGDTFSLLLMAEFGLDPVALASLSGNSAAVANYLQSLLLTDALDGDPRRDALSDLAMLDASTLTTAANEMHPEIFAVAPALAAYERSWALTESFNQQMRLRRTDTGNSGVWLTGIGGTSDLDGSSSRSTSGVDSNFEGTVFGGDIPLDANRRSYVGAFVGAEQHDQSYDGLPASQEYEGLVFGVYGGFTHRSTEVMAMLAYHSGETDTRRSTSALVPGERLEGRYDLDGWTASLGVQWPALWSNDRMTLRPDTALTYAQFDRDRLVEQGGSFALDVSSDRYESLFGEFALVLAASSDASRVRPEIGIGWRYNLDFENETAAASLVGVSTPTFNAQGSRIPRSMAFLNGSLTWSLQERMQIYLEYDAVNASGYLSHSGHIGLRAQF